MDFKLGPQEAAPLAPSSLGPSLHRRYRCRYRTRVSVLVLLASMLTALIVPTLPMVSLAQQSPLGSAGPLPTEYVEGEVIIKLKGKARGLESQAFIGKAVSENAMSLKGSWSGLNLHHFALKPGQSVERMIEQLKSDPQVLYAEPNYIVRIQSTGLEGAPVSLADVRSDAESSVDRLHHQSGDQSGDQVTAFSTSPVFRFSQTSAPIQLNQAWSAVSSAREPTIVAIIDTGLDLNHQVFTESGALWRNPAETINGIDDDGNGYIDDLRGWNFVSGHNSPQDDDGHGTHVAGIVLGATQDITSNPISQAQIRIMPLKFLDASGSGSTSDAIKAIYYAVNNGAKVLNNSWGGGGYSAALLDAIAYAYDRKVAFVAAAGNSSSNNDAYPIYPANYSVPNMIAVAATSDYDAFANFSNYGLQSVHMGSPGVSIWSTLPGNMFGRSSGTSMAAPFVAGVAAMMMREVPQMSGYQVKNLIFAGAQSISSLQSRTITKSRLNVYNSILAAKSASLDSYQPVFVASAPQRDPDAVESEVAGCGLVSSAILGADGGPGNSLPPMSVLVLTFVSLLSPLLVAWILRNRVGSARRRHERFKIDSAVTIKMGDKELYGQVSTISLGGAQLNTEALLEKGGIVKMLIRSPDGREEIQVEGQIVWSEEKKHYGVAFSQADEPVRAKIARWTVGLMKA